jgi:hypothetical protein
MPAILTNYHVKDYNKWLDLYQEYEPQRREAGVTKTSIWTAVDDPNHVYVLMECRDVKKLEQAWTALKLKDLPKHAGVIGETVVTILNEGATKTRQAGQHA